MASCSEQSSQHPDLQTEDELIKERARLAPMEVRAEYYIRLMTANVRRERAQATPWDEQAVEDYKAARDARIDFETEYGIEPPGPHEIA